MSSKKSNCIFAAAWVTLAVFAAILVIFFIISSIFDLGVWNEFWDWVFSKNAASPPGDP